MNSASEVVTQANQANEPNDPCGFALHLCAEAGAEEDQDWEREETRYTFPDGSVVVANGVAFNAFDSIEAARAGLVCKVGNY